MITVSDKWLTTPVVCNICGHRTQLVCEVKVIEDNGKEHVKLPNDVNCSQCGSVDVEYVDLM